MTWNFGGHAARGGNQPLGMRRQKVVVNARIVVKTIHLRGGGDFEQVFVAGFIFGQQQQVAGLFIQFGVAVLHATRGHVSFHADDGFDPGFFGGVVEFDHAEHGAVVGNRQRGHVHFFGAFDQLLDVGKTIQERVNRVGVQVNEGHGAGGGEGGRGEEERKEEEKRRREEKRRWEEGETGNSGLPVTDN